MSNGAYALSVLASVLLIAAAAAPLADRLLARGSGGPAFTAQMVVIGGLSASTSADRLREFLAHVDGVESATVVTDGITGDSRGFGVVEMVTADAANTAVRELNGRQLDGRRVRVEHAHTFAGATDIRGDFAGRRW
jgi:hypothetical protein